MLLWQSYQGRKTSTKLFYWFIYVYQNTKFLVIREKNFTLIPCLLEELGSSTISHLFRKRLMPVAPLFMVRFSKFNISLKLETKPHNNICAIKFCGFVKVAKFATLNRSQNFIDLQYA